MKKTDFLLPHILTKIAISALPIAFFYCNFAFNSSLAEVFDGSDLPEGRGLYDSLPGNNKKGTITPQTHRTLPIPETMAGQTKLKYSKKFLSLIY